MLFILTIIMLVLTLRSRSRNSSWINPITAFVLWDFLLFTAIPIQFGAPYIEEFSTQGFAKFTTLQYTYILGGIVGFTLIPNNAYLRLFSTGPKYFLQGKVLSPGLIWLLFLMTIFVLFLALASAGGGGLMWITDTRSAYINHRAGAGIFWLLIQWLSMTVLGFVLFKYKPKSILKLFLLIIPFLILGFFTGSKHNLATPLIVAVLYHEYFIRRVRLSTLIAIAIFFSIAFTLTLYFQSRSGEFSWLIGAFYFAEYAVTSTRYLADEFLPVGLGQYSLSGLWYYVPRGLYPDKPFEYGVLNIHKELFPGAASIGNTPGISPWMLVYIDFGYLGVFLYGLILTSFSLFLFDLFRKNKRSAFIFLFMIHVSIFQLFALWPALATGLILILLFHFRYGKKTL